MLEGFMRRDEINVVHSGTVGERYEALMSGETDAATLMEPWVTLAHKNGCKELVGTFYQGTENSAATLDSKVWEAANRAVRKAVKLINQDKGKYVHYLIEEIPEKYAKQLKPEDFYLPRLRYVDPAPYTQASGPVGGERRAVIWPAARPLRGPWRALPGSWRAPVPHVRGEWLRRY
jgi:NitT/TauT family transport system substrate-binding protein